MCRVSCNGTHEQRRKGVSSEKQLPIFRKSEKDIVFRKARRKQRKKTRKKVEIMTTMMKELGNFCNSDIREQAKRICNLSEDQNHYVSFSYYQKGPWKGSFLNRLFLFRYESELG